MTHPAPNMKSHGSAVGLWDRAALIMLAALAFALSYNALRQTAAAAHVQGPLTYAFPLIIDGFIAYGVRALLILRRARILARAYAWVLFTAATGASTWANVLHAIRLNEQTTAAQGLRLSDRVVGALAVIAPLALAGVVHLYILITRETTPSDQAGTPGPEAGTAIGTPVPEPDPEHGQATDRPTTGTRPRRRVGRPPGTELDRLLALARPLFQSHATPTRAAVRQAIRVAGHSLSEERLTQVMTTLRAEHQDR